MHYNFNLEIPANRTEANKIEKVCKINYGIIRKVNIYFRGGCADLAHVEIFRGNQKIMPYNPEENYAFDDYAVEFEAFYPILDKPYLLNLFGWNEDDTFSHTVTFMFNILHPKVTEIPEMEGMSEEAALELLGDYEMEGSI